MRLRDVLRPRRPRFALVLVAIALPIVLALALTSRSSSPSTATPPNAQLGGTGPGRACVLADAHASATARGTVHASATGQVPVLVTERVKTATAIVSVKRGETVVERQALSRGVAVTQTAVVKSRACAHGSTTDAARGRALRRGYREALRLARQKAPVAAQARLKALIQRLTPPLQAQAQQLANASAQAAAVKVRAALVHRALSQAAASGARTR